MLKLVGDVCFTDNHFDVGFGVGSVIKAGFNPFAKGRFSDLFHLRCLPNGPAVSGKEYHK